MAMDTFDDEMNTGMETLQPESVIPAEETGEVPAGFDAGEGIELTAEELRQENCAQEDQTVTTQKKKRASRKKADTPSEETAEVSEPPGESVPAPAMDMAAVPELPTAEEHMADSVFLPKELEDDDLDAAGDERDTSNDDILVMELAEEEPGGDEATGAVDMEPPPAVGEAAAPARPLTRARENRPVARHTPLLSLNLNELDRNLTRDERDEWNEIYASYRSKSVITGNIIGVDPNAFYVRDRETGALTRRRMYCAVVIKYRVKVLIPETEFWMPGEERPSHVLRNLSGAEIDYMILDVDREGGTAIASRRMGSAAQQRRFDLVRNGHTPGERLTCRVLGVGPSRCLLECGGRDLTLSYREMSYANISDLREKYHCGDKLDCILTAYDRASKTMEISVKAAEPHPFEGITVRHPKGSRRYATISGKYGGGIFCTIPDGTTCLCLYTPQHSDRDFHIGDKVLLVVTQFDYDRMLVYGRILAKW